MHGEEVQQFILPHYFQNKVLKSNHDDSGHQGLERTLELLQSQVFWPNMFKEVDTYLLNCEHCQVSKGNYVGPKTQLGVFVSKTTTGVALHRFDKSRPFKRWKGEYISSHVCLFKVQSSFCNQ